MINYENYESAEIAFFYAKEILQKPWSQIEDQEIAKKAEFIISQDIEYSFEYANEIIKNRFYLCEEKIAQDSYYAMLYAKEILHGSWLASVGGQLALKAENKILENEKYWDSYLFFLIKNKSEVDEPKIATQGKYAYRYARDILNGSWKEKIGGELAIKAEKAISDDQVYCLKYSHLFYQ